MLSRKGKRPVTQKLPHPECYDLEIFQKFSAPQKLGRSGLDRRIRYHVTNAEVGAPLNIPFALSNVPCIQDDAAILLSTKESGYRFGEWLHVCRSQAALSALEAEFRPERLLVR